jgi:hypothetical protein
MPILYNVGNKLTAGSEPPQLYRYQDRVLGDGGTLETRDEASTFIRRLRSAGVLGSTVIAGVAGGYKAGTLYSIIGPDLDVTRGTVKNRVNRAGVLSEVASGVPATDFAGGVLRGTTVEPSSRNEIRNNTMQGAVVGVIGSGGARPTNWAGANPAGLSEEIVSSTVIDGIEVLTVRFFGTADATANRTLYFDANAAITASNGQAWTGSLYFQVINAPSPPTNYRSVITERTDAGSFIAQESVNIQNSSVFSRKSQTRTLSGGGTVARVQFGVDFPVVNGQSYDFTIRIGLPQMELSSVATSVIKTTGSAQTRNADVITDDLTLPQTSGIITATLNNRLITGTRTIATLRGASTTWPVELRNNRFGFRDVVQGADTTAGTHRVSVWWSDSGATYRLYVDGALIGTEQTGATPISGTIGTFDYGMNNSTNWLNDALSEIAVISGGTPSQAQTLSTL